MENWKIFRLSDFIEINPKVPLSKGNLYPFIEMKDLSESQKHALPSQIKQLTGGARFQNGDTLFARITPCLENGKICQVTGLRDNIGFGSTEFLVFRGKEGISNTDFVYYLSQYQYVRAFAEQNMVGTSGRQRVSKEAFQEIELKLPLLPIQNTIAEILSSLDDKIEINNAINRNLEELAQALFKRWFVDFEFPNENGQPYKSSGGEMVESELGLIPKGWRIGKINEITTVKGGTTPSTKEPRFWNGQYHWTSPRDLSNIQFPVLLNTDKTITKEGLDKISSGLLSKGTLLLSSRAPIGYLAITEIETAINQGYIAIQCRNGYSNLFMLFWLKQNMASVIEMANGSTFLEISKSNFKEIDLVIPDIKNHDKGMEIVNSIFNQIILNLKENHNLENLRDTLLPKLISGDLEVKEVLKQTEKVL